MKIFSMQTAGNVSRTQSTHVCMHVLGAGRTDVRVMRAATALTRAGFLVSIVDIEVEQRPAREEINGVCLHHLLIRGWLTARTQKFLFLWIAIQVFWRSTIALFRTRADVYHAHDLTALPACYLASRLRNKPLIFEAHELPPPETSIAFWQKLTAVLIHFLRRVIPRCAGVITVSQPIANEIQQRYGGPDPVLVRNIPPYRKTEKSQRLREHLGIGANVHIALYQGNIQPDRELDRLVRAAPFLASDIVLVLMGKDVRGTVAALERLIQEEGVAERVAILPPVLYNELLDWTASADIGLNILPPHHSLNIRWCLPNKLFEYLMAGLPVLTSQLEAVADIVTTYEVGQVVPSLEPQEIAAAINRLCADRAALTRMHENALRVAHEELCWEKEQQNLISLYRNVGARTRKREVLA